MARKSKFSPEVRERAVRMVLEHGPEHGSEWEAMRTWVRRYQIDSGQRRGVTSAEQARVTELERENRELRRANEILRKASAYFAQAELDRRPK